MTRVKKDSREQSHLLKEGVGAADKPLRLLHLGLQAGDSLHRRQAGDSCADFGAG